MRASSRNFRQVGKAAGFSLLELLLALFIVGLIVSLAGLGVSSGGRSHEVDAALKRFADIAEYALDEAQFHGIDMGLFIDSRPEGGAARFGYQWMRRDAGGWRPAPFDEDAYGRKDIPRGVEVRLEVEQGNALADERDELAAGGERDQPQVLFYSSGETTPGVMTWVEADSGAVLWELEWDLLGRLSLRRRGETDWNE